jgi:RimJ/RimL family protein N-acetyltransferase
LGQAAAAASERFGLAAPTLSCDDLVLRPWRRRDASALAAACGDPAICAFTTVPRSYSDVAAGEWVARQQRRLADGTAVVLAIELTSQAALVGTVWLFDFDGLPSARVGCWLLAGHRRRGIGQRAVKVIARWGFQELDLLRVRFEFLPDNSASRRLCAEVGAVRNGLRERASSIGPTLVECWMLPFAPA